MFRLVLYALNDDYSCEFKMYWNNRLNEFTFSNPSLLTAKEAYNLIVKKYNSGTIVKNNDVTYNNYYIYSVEEVK